MAAKEGKAEGLGKRGNRQWTEILSSEPRALIYHNFLCKEECEYLINLAKPHMARSLVSDGITGKAVESSSRTSDGASLRRGGNNVLKDIEKRIADYTVIPVENGEGLYVMHYGMGQKFDPHFDYNEVNKNTMIGGPRKATLVMYLSDVEEGGETVFPNAKKFVSSVAEKGVSVKPKMGDALLFWSMLPDKTRDPSSLHGGNPVIKGEKWACTKWMHEREFK